MAENGMIEFRGKSKDKSEWIYGSLLQDDYGNSCIVCFVDHHETWFDVVSVDQFIGLQDKKEQMAFFNDIVKFTPKVLNRFGSKYIDARYELLAIIDKDEYNHSVLRILNDKGEFKKGDIYHIDGLENGEVIGNKIDNPELLEE